MSNDTAHFAAVATFVVLWGVIYAYYRMRRLTKHLDERYWLLRPRV